jgi:hypothetical protein
VVKLALVFFPIFPSALTENGKHLPYKAIYEFKDEDTRK